MAKETETKKTISQEKAKEAKKVAVQKEKEKQVEKAKEAKKIAVQKEKEKQKANLEKEKEKLKEQQKQAINAAVEKEKEKQKVKQAQAVDKAVLKERARIRELLASGKDPFGKENPLSKQALKKGTGFANKSLEDEKLLEEQAKEEKVLEEKPVEEKVPEEVKEEKVEPKNQELDNLAKRLGQKKNLDDLFKEKENKPVEATEELDEKDLNHVELLRKKREAQMKLNQDEKKENFNLDPKELQDKVDSLEKDLENIKMIKKDEGKKYIKKGRHRNINDWNYFFFEKNTKIGDNTLHFIKKSIIDKDYKNLILFYSGLNDFTYTNLLEFYDNQPSTYHINIIIITKKNEEFVVPSLKKYNQSFIRNVVEDNMVEQLINIIEVTSYCNELGDEIGFPKKFIDTQLIDKDSKLMIKHSFTFNILVCGRPGGGKSLLINRILRKEKCFSGKGNSSLTMHVVKYIHDKLPLVIYDTPGFEGQEDIERVNKLINEKNKNCDEEKNRIHCVFYCLNTTSERSPAAGEFKFIKSLLKFSMKYALNKYMINSIKNKICNIHIIVLYIFCI